MKIMTHRSISLDTLRKNLRMLWKTNELEAELFLVEFGDVKDKKKVLDMSPWSFEKQLVIIQEFEGEFTPKEMELKWSPFWIQIFNLPLMSWTKETGWVIGSSLGNVMEVDVLDSGVHWGKCLRVWVRIDATKKLIRGKRITIEGSESRWVQFKYERLPNFCYRYGLLNHALKDCPASSGNGRTVEEGLQYGAWLRGDPYGRSQKESVKYRGNENQGSRSRVAGVRLERTQTQFDVPGEKIVESGNHVPMPLPLGSNSLSRDDASLEAQRHLIVTPHGEGKGEGAGVKSENRISSKLDNSSVIISTQSEITEEMQWEKVLHQPLRKTPLEVNPISAPIPILSPSVSVFSGFEEDIPPGLGGQHMGETIVTKVVDKFEELKGICEYVDKNKLELFSSPSKKSSGPSLDAKRANPLVGSFELGQNQVNLLILNSHVTHGPQLTDISNHQIIKHASHTLGPKWTRVLRSSPGNKKALLSHVGQKKGSVLDSDQLELPKKKI